MIDRKNADFNVIGRGFAQEEHHLRAQQAGYKGLIGIFFRIL